LHPNLQILKINISPLQGEEFAAPESRGRGEEYHCAKAAIQFGKQSTQLFGFQAFWDSLPLGTLSNHHDGILPLLQPFMADGVIEKNAH
jgi:hypothetical protein